MKLAVSNIAWKKDDEEKILSYLNNKGFKAIEIAPTAIIQDKPYDNLNTAKKYADKLKKKYNLNICSMQSIWYGITENIFNENDLKYLIDYTKKAIDFASKVECNNIVFGCPKNRNKNNVNDSNKKALIFFKEIAQYALYKNVIISIEPNPVIYNTNFINTTEEAIEFAKLINLNSFKVNIDFGTIIENKEDLQVIYDNIEYINHIHISEPNLLKIKNRKIHKEFLNNLNQLNYNKYISIEMKKTDDINDLIDSIDYLWEINYEI